MKTIEQDVTYINHIKQAEAELYSALEALEKQDLSFARSSAARAQSAVVEAWRVRNDSGNPSKTLSEG